MWLHTVVRTDVVPRLVQRCCSSAQGTCRHMHQQVMFHLQGLDVGPDSVKLIQDTLADAQTVLWNGAHPAIPFLLL